MIKITPPMREQDSYGAGYYRAPRGSRKHNGIDYACYPDSLVHAFTGGTVTKLGYTYGDDLSFRYVQITDSSGYLCRYFYVEPCVLVGETISKGTIIGAVQDLTKRYPADDKHEKEITNHFHFEVKTKNGDFIDPNAYYELDRV